MSPDVEEVEKNNKEAIASAFNLFWFIMFVGAVFILLPPVVYWWRLWAHYWSWVQ